MPDPENHNAFLARQDDDIELLLKYRKGRGSALEELLVRHKKSIYNFICRRTNDFSIANELIQELSLKVVENIDKFKPERAGSFRQWLYQIATNLCNDYFRHRQRARSFEAEIKTRLTGYDKEVNFEVNLETEELLARLPEEQKEVVLLKIYSGLTFQEISEIVKCPLNTVISRMHYALKTLRKNLKNI
ncbi:MAG: sigma-70 family RNA polymerase sigma factor [Candidatus Brocadiia bacterium]